MLNDGIGAAIAGANAVMTSHGDMDSASAEDRADALARALTGGAYVRSVFLYSPARFARAGRDGAREIGTAQPPVAAVAPFVAERIDLGGQALP